jgi:hypothetical protein
VTNPVASPSIRANQPGIEAEANIHAATMDESAATEPTDRSIPAVTITKV